MSSFLIDIDKVDEIESYLLIRAAQLNGDYDDPHLSLAKSFTTHQRYLVTSILYRSLLNSILKRTYTKAYSHGVRYLKTLDQLATQITDWRGKDNHNAFMEQLQQTHYRKHSFWTKYELKK